MSRIEPSLSDIDDADTYGNSLAAKPQHLSSTKLASVGRRYVGQVIDGLISVLLYLVCLKLASYVVNDTENASWIALFAAASYFLLSDGLPKGQSIAKRFLRITVIDKDSGAYCSYFQSFGRNILSPFIGWIDAIFILFQGKRRLGDRMANTIVIKNQD
ncbi:hypothetical protein AHAT_28890 [Agarivorans sp. Toyoura001]|uniref:RDD family protein n=1 Tax=Agarivorans sp. Toyoura001 TaxID=2283141 RepID=UPI0010D123E5|nr:RDD family protein [Agarivorans sp. Toyoura001]GDY26999.1 hypothetical protein AHAT_28890 [Agarivorans sp. Toyoura001]